MYPEADDVSEYLVSDAIIDWESPAVREKALELTGSLSDEVAKARCLYEWVRDNISHTADAGLDIVTCRASEVLHHGTGICFAKSHLLAALLRAKRQASALTRRIESTLNWACFPRPATTTRLAGIFPRL